MGLRRLKPKTRVSKTALKLWDMCDIKGLEAYYRGIQISNKYMHRGKVIHEALEVMPPTHDIERLCGDGEIEMEKKLEIERDNYVLVGVLDLLVGGSVVADYKTGRRNNKDKFDINYYQYLVESDKWGYVFYVDESLQLKDALPVKPLTIEIVKDIETRIDELVDFLELYFRDELI